MSTPAPSSERSRHTCFRTAQQYVMLTAMCLEPSGPGSITGKKGLRRSGIGRVKWFTLDHLFSYIDDQDNISFLIMFLP